MGGDAVHAVWTITINLPNVHVDNNNPLKWEREILTGTSLHRALFYRVSILYSDFVVSRCAFCKIRKNFGFSCSVNHLSGPLRKHMGTCTSSKGTGLGFVIGEFRAVLFVSFFKFRCFVIVLYQAIIDQF